MSRSCWHRASEVASASAAELYCSVEALGCRSHLVVVISFTVDVQTFAGQGGTAAVLLESEVPHVFFYNLLALARTRLLGVEQQRTVVNLARRSDAPHHIRESRDPSSGRQHKLPPSHHPGLRHGVELSMCALLSDPRGHVGVPIQVVPAREQGLRLVRALCLQRVVLAKADPTAKALYSIRRRAPLFPTCGGYSKPVWHPVLRHGSLRIFPFSSTCALQERSKMSFVAPPGAVNAISALFAATQECVRRATTPPVVQHANGSSESRAESHHPLRTHVPADGGRLQRGPGLSRPRREEGRRPQPAVRTKDVALI
eukprot:scaffold1849_cov239-Pinguiococcus_pyrenoidosus.AAC.9